MHVVNKQCILTTIGIVLLAVGTGFALFWMDIFIRILSKVSYDIFEFY